MDQIYTRDRITAQCIQEANAVQDMLAHRATPESLLKRILERIRMAFTPKNSSSVTEFPATPSPANILFDRAAAGPPFALWYESEQPRAANRKADTEDRTGIPNPA